MKLQRYKFFRDSISNCFCEVDESEKGGYVLADEAEALIPKWISVKDRLPEKAGKYAVITNRHETWQTRWFRPSDNVWEGDTKISYTTHWIPLPEPPQDKGEK
jgi:hypothetical protein